MSLVKEISVFFPAYNEAENITEVVRKALAVLEEIADNYEVLVINDGSLDNTVEVVTNLIKENKSVKLITHRQNQGYGGAIKTGLYSSRYDLIAFNDGDGQFDFSQIRGFLPKLSGADLVIGYRKKRSDPFFRLINAKLYSIFLFALFGLRVRDVDCAFKLIKKEVVDALPNLESNGALISAELLIRARKKGFRIAQVPVNHFPRTFGSPTGANLKVIVKMFGEVLKLYRDLK